MWLIYEIEFSVCNFIATRKCKIELTEEVKNVFHSSADFFLFLCSHVRNPQNMAELGKTEVEHVLPFTHLIQWPDFYVMYVR